MRAHSTIFSRNCTPRALGVPQQYMAVFIELPAFTKLGPVGADAFKRQPLTVAVRFSGVRFNVAHGADAAIASRVEARFNGTTDPRLPPCRASCCDMQLLCLHLIQ